VADANGDQPESDQSMDDQSVDGQRGDRRSGKRRWGDLSPGTRAVLALLGAVEVALAAVAWTDLIRRPRDQVRGPKWRWAMVIPVNIIGPLVYLRWGRVRPDARSSS
jgi:hypothetical protein